MLSLRRPEACLAVLLALVLAGCSQPGAGPSTTLASVTSTTTTSTVPSTVTSTGGTTTTGEMTTTTEPRPRVLVFHKTAGFTHQSIPAGIESVRAAGAEAGFDVTASDDASLLVESAGSEFDVIVFLNTTGDILDPAQQQAMEEFIRAGNGFVGVHSATDTEYDWSWYGGLVGAYFDSHPSPQPAVVNVTQEEHPVMAGLPARIETSDEWYNFSGLPAPEVTVLATVDESTYDGGTMGDPHPIVWAHEYDGGRSVYAAFGHSSEDFEEPFMRQLLANAVLWAAGSANG